MEGASQEPSSIEKVAEVDEHIGVAMSGLTADARTLVEHARVETQVHRHAGAAPGSARRCLRLTSGARRAATPLQLQ